jgi:hypothetical protein
MLIDEFHSSYRKGTAMNDLADRVEQLERSNRRWRVGTLTGVAVVGCIVMVGADQKSTHGKFDKLFVSEEIRVGKTDGGPVVSISSHDEGTQITMVDGMKREQVELLATETGAIFRLSGASGGRLTSSVTDKRDGEIESGQVQVVMKPAGAKSDTLRLATSHTPERITLLVLRNEETARVKIGYLGRNLLNDLGK